MSSTATVSRVEVGSDPVAAGRSATAGALVMGADYRGLGVVRSLGRHGIPVWVIKHGGHLVATASRYARRSVPWPTGSEVSRIDFLLDLGARHELNGWVIFPTDDYAVALVARHYGVLATMYRLTVPPWEETQWASDKRLLYLLARRLGIPQPWTAFPRTKEELASIGCPFPAVLKPAIRLQPNTIHVPKAWRADDYPSLLRRYDEACALVPSENLMLQELVPGGGEAQFSYAALCKDGCPLASIVARRTRQYPADFGQFSTFVETIDEPAVVAPGVRLLKAMRFTGLVELEFKKDIRTGRHKLLDFNPRVWGWHTLSRRCGIDFPYLLWLLVNGKPVPQTSGHAGERWVHMTGDVIAALQEILKGRLRLGAYLRSAVEPRESALFAWDDPAPGLLDLPLLACTLGVRFFQRKAT